MNVLFEYLLIDFVYLLTDERMTKDEFAREVLKASQNKKAELLHRTILSIEFETIRKENGIILYS